MKNKDVIDFLNRARPTILDLTPDNIKIIEKDKELMKILKEEAKDMSEGYGTDVGADTDLSPYSSLGWYLAANLRSDIQNYYRLKYGIVMASFLAMKYGDSICREREPDEYAKKEYKKLFGREMNE